MPCTIPVFISREVVAAAVVVAPAVAMEDSAVKAGSVAMGVTVDSADSVVMAAREVPVVMAEPVVAEVARLSLRLVAVAHAR
jgi:hypothetical protein